MTSHVSVRIDKSEVDYVLRRFLTDDDILTPTNSNVFCAKNLSLSLTIMLETWHLLIFKLFLLNLFGKKEFLVCTEYFLRHNGDNIPY